MKYNHYYVGFILNNTYFGDKRVWELTTPSVAEQEIETHFKKQGTGYGFLYGNYRSLLDLTNENLNEIQFIGWKNRRFTLEDFEEYQRKQG